MTEEQKQEVRRLVERGMTVPEIAQKTDVSQQSIHRLCKKERLKITPARGRLPATDKELRKQIRLLGTVEKVATKFGVTRAAVYWRVARMT